MMHILTFQAAFGLYEGVNSSIRNIYLKPLRSGKTDRLESIQEKVNALAKSMDIQRPIKVVYSPGYSWASHGFNGEQFEMGITVSDMATKPCSENVIEHYAQPFILAREVCHLKSFPLLGLAFVPYIVSLAVSLFVGFQIGSILATGAGLASFFAAKQFIYNYRERYADKIACSHTNDREKLGYVHYLVQQKREAIRYRNDATISHPEHVLRKFLYAKNGDCRLEMGRAERIEKILASMENRPADHTEAKLKEQCKNLKKRVANPLVYDEWGNYHPEIVKQYEERARKAKTVHYSLLALGIVSTCVLVRQASAWQLVAGAASLYAWGTFHNQIEKRIKGVFI